MPLKVVLWTAVSSRQQAADDKISLAEQERMGREWAAQNDGEVIEVLSVPGHSRRESDVVTLLEDYARLGVNAYSRLREMWQQKSFDALWAYAHNRLGRSTTLHSYVVENVILSGAIIRLHHGGTIDRQNLRYQTAFGGAESAGELDRFAESSMKAKSQLLAKGLPLGPYIAMSHRLIRDPRTGKGSHLELNPDMTSLWQDFATLYLQGIAYNHLGDALYDFYGHIDPVTGKAYSRTTLYYVFSNPMFWGHMARRHSHSERSAWIFDEDAPLPDGVIVERNVIPAVYTGDLAERVKAEFRRRSELSGRAKPGTTYRYSRVFVCGKCNANMAVHSKRRRRTGVRCLNAHLYSRAVTPCGGDTVPTARLDEIAREFISKHLEGVRPSAVESDGPASAAQLQYAESAKELSQIEAQIGTLIAEQSRAPEVAQSYYRQQIEGLSHRAKKLKQTVERLEVKVAEVDRRVKEETQTADEIRQMTLDRFFDLPDVKINQYMHRLLGDWRIVLVDGEPIGFRKAMKRKKRGGFGRRP